MTMVVAVVATLSMLMLPLGFVLGRVWEIRQELLSKKRRATDELARERRAEDELMRQQALNRFITARRWA